MGAKRFHGAVSSSWNYYGNWTPPEIPVADDDVTDDVNGYGMAVDITTPQLKSFLQTVNANGINVNGGCSLWSTLIDLYGPVHVDVAGGIFCSGGAAADRKVYLRAGSSLTGSGTKAQATLNMFGEAKMMELAGTVSGITIAFFINSTANPLQAQDYSGFLSALFIHNGAAGIREIYFQAGTHKFPETDIVSEITGADFRLRMDINNPDVEFLGNVLVAKAAGTSISISLGSGVITAKKNFDTEDASVNGSGTILFNGVALQDVAMNPDSLFGGSVAFSNRISGCRIATGAVIAAGFAFVDGALNVTGELRSFYAFDMSSHAVLSGAGDIRIYSSVVSQLEGISTFSGKLYVEVQTNEDPTEVRLNPLDYAAKFPEMIIEATSEEFAQTCLFGEGDYKLPKTTLRNGAAQSQLVTYDWEANDPNVEVIGDFAISNDNGTTIVKFGAGKLTLHGHVNMQLAQEFESPGEVVLAGSSGSHNVIFGDFLPATLTVDCAGATKTLAGGRFYATLQIKGGTLKLGPDTGQTVTDLIGTGGTIKSADDYGQQAYIDLAHKSAAAGVSFKDVWLNAKDMVNAKSGGTNLGNTKGIIFRDRCRAL